MPDSEDVSQRDAVRELVARYAANFSVTELTELALRLLKAEETRSSWDRLLGDVVACAVYNGVDLVAAEQLIVHRY